LDTVLIMRDDIGAFIDPTLAIDGTPDGVLSGLTCAVKDIYDIVGFVTGYGSPDWARTHPPASKTAASVQALLDAGALVRGKTHTDELAYSLNGENAHYGTPVNVNAPRRIPGGSSGGSAAAVAAELVDVALGSDTGGSIRIPASYCGLYGLRPTHGRIPPDGVLPLASSYDVIGWFARDPEILATVGSVLLPGYAPSDALPARLLVPTDLWALADLETSGALQKGSDALATLIGDPIECAVAPAGALPDWFTAFRVTQGWEIWNAHGDWVTAHNPSLGPGIKDRVAWASTITADQRDDALAVRSAAAAHVESLLPAGTMMVFPTAPGPAPLKGQSAESLEAFRYRALQLTSVAGLAGLPQINLPLGQVEGDDGPPPVGLSIMGGKGSDEALLMIAKTLGGTAKGGIAALR